MNLPEKFKFKTECRDTVYKARMNYDTGMFNVTWKVDDQKMHMNSQVSAAQDNVKDGHWVLLEKKSSSKLVKATNKLNILITEKLDAGLYDDASFTGIELTGYEFEYLELSKQLIETLLDVAEIA